MQWKDLLGYTGAELKAMTDKELLELFGPSLKVTRPEHAPRLDTKAKGATSAVKAKTAKANDILGQLGFDIEL
jgi:hypothetical protein